MGLPSLNKSSRPWGVGACLCGLVPGPRILGQGVEALGVRGGEAVGVRLVSLDMEGMPEVSGLLS